MYVTYYMFHSFLNPLTHWHENTRVNLQVRQDGKRCFEKSVQQSLLLYLADHQRKQHHQNLCM